MSLIGFLQAVSVKCNIYIIGSIVLFALVKEGIMNLVLLMSSDSILCGYWLVHGEANGLEFPTF